MLDMNKCKGICNRETVPVIPRGKARYEFCKRCNLCNKWFIRDGRNRCICCSSILRRSKRSGVKEDIKRM